MDLNHIERNTEQRAGRRAKKKHRPMRMSGKRTREVLKLWRKRANH